MANAFRKYFLVKDAIDKGTQSPMENNCSELKQLSKAKKTKPKFLCQFVANTGFEVQHGSKEF